MYLRFFSYGRKLFLLVLIVFSVCFSTVSRAEIIVDAMLSYWHTGPAMTTKIVSADVNDPTPNPCYGDDSCIMYVKFDRVGGGNGIAQPTYYRMYNFKTMGEIGAELYRIGAVGREQTIGNTSTSVKCIYFGYQSRSSGNGPLPGSPCRAPIINPSQCYFDQGSANIDYGVVSADRLNGLIAQTALYVSCTQDLRVKIISAEESMGTVNLRPDGSLKAKITVNDAPLSNGYTFTATPAGTALNIKSELISLGEIPPGDFYGSTVVVISPA
ncbi:hypothetical protein [Serratia plymuthica]|uniref:Fimbrial adhesin MrpH C-terminal domain-containing protein n=1 Tax=Serratia plymuthica TaxID=82996 RepID=A0A2X4VHS0_SERPL|nr:hypothetical protein [Serratia plymuthica]QPS18644.1 hypothetical protein I6G64_13570 [Serratia plymuthica]QPS64917.1 hypothetical protein I6G52_09365 [Serratia plymuthica]RKS62627.1 hypothetical protein C8E17_1820 [Serratia plymuthica]CAI2500278.1 Uncharacterised protein [Serratia plymuthica]SQI46352.1 Uncharacterised protein [Serratia plymuthica]